MNLYLGNSEKLKVYLNGISYIINIPTTRPITEGVLLSTIDNVILKDSNGVYITAKKEDEAL